MFQHEGQGPRNYKEKKQLKEMVHHGELITISWAAGLVPYRWQRVKTSHKPNAQCSGNTKNCFKTDWQLSVCHFYFCHFGRLSI